MGKVTIFGTVAVFVVWFIMDFIIHGVLLQGIYAETAALWRPMEEMKQGVIFGVQIVAALFFTLLFALGYSGGDMGRSLRFGLYYGLGVGVSMGFGTYAVQAIPPSLAVSWLVATLAEALAAAFVLHWVYGRFGASK